MLRRPLLITPAPFNPLVYSPALWLDASDIATLFQDRTGASASTPVASNADPVGTWKDKSGNARHLIAPSDAARPTYETGSLNGLSGLLFDGLNDVLQLTDASAIKALSNITVIGVVKPTAAASANTTTCGHLIFLHNAAATEIWFCAGSTSTALLSGETILAYGDSTGASKRLGSSTYSRSANTHQVWSASLGSAGVTLHVNGSAVNLDLAVNTTTSTASGPSLTTITSPLLSHPVPAGNAGEQRTLELLVFPSVLSTSQRQQVERYLGNKWGITVA